MLLYINLKLRKKIPNTDTTGTFFEKYRNTEPNGHFSRFFHSFAKKSITNSHEGEWDVGYIRSYSQKI